MIATFAYDKSSSPVNALSNAHIVRHEPTQYMSLCQFNNVYWEFDKNQNYAPCIVFEGNVERLDAIDKKFPGNVDTVYFTENKPTVQFRYKLDEDQLAALAKKGFWSEDGVNMPAVFTTAKFQLETYAVVEEITNGKENRKVPVFNVELIRPYENEFDSAAYELIDKVSRRKPEESKVIEKSAQHDVQQDITAEIEALMESMREMTERDSTASSTEYKPLTAEELDIQNKSANVNASVVAERDALKNIRAAGNARAAAERDAERVRAEAERTMLMGFGGKVEPVEEPVVAESETTNLVNNVEVNKYESNNDIFSNVESTDEKIPDKVAELMKQLGADALTDSEATEKKDDKRGGNSDSGSGTASGTQGLGVYTFEDQSTAQFEMRADEGKGNEKEESDETDISDKKDASTDLPDMDQRKAKLVTSINDAAVAADTKSDKSDRSK